MKKSKIRALSCLLAVMLCMTVFSTTAFADGGDYYDYELPLETAESGQPFSEESEIYTRDLLYDQDAHKQFITIQDRDGNTFYIVIDYDSPVSEEEEQYKTYFLNPVDLADLEGLAEDGGETEPAVCICTDKCAAGAVNTACPVCAVNMTECVARKKSRRHRRSRLHPWRNRQRKTTWAASLWSCSLWSWLAALRSTSSR